MCISRGGVPTAALVDAVVSARRPDLLGELYTPATAAAARRRLATLPAASKHEDTGPEAGVFALARQLLGGCGRLGLPVILRRGRVAGLGRLPPLSVLHHGGCQVGGVDHDGLLGCRAGW
jgi:hypothetical protein